MSSTPSWAPGSAEGAVDAANIIKPALGRGEIQVIGATTLNEYRKYIEKDAALGAPVPAGAGGRAQPGGHAGDPEGACGRSTRSTTSSRSPTRRLEAAVKLSARYINDRFLPDKAIDLMDEAASRVRLETEELSPELKSLERKIAALAKDKEAAIAAQDYEKAAQLRDIEKDYREQVELERDRRRKNNAEHRPVTADDIAAVGVRLDRHPRHPSHRGRGASGCCTWRTPSTSGWWGQDEAVKAVARAIRRGPRGSEGPQGAPSAPSLFLGPHRAWARRSCASPWPRPCSATRTP